MIPQLYYGTLTKQNVRKLALRLLWLLLPDPYRTQLPKLLGVSKDFDSISSSAAAGGFGGSGGGGANFMMYISSYSPMLSDYLNDPRNRLGIFGVSPAPYVTTTIKQSGSEVLAVLYNLVWGIAHNADSCDAILHGTDVETIFQVRTNSSHEYFIHRSVHKFSLADIPAGKSITSGVLHMTGQDGYGNFWATQATSITALGNKANYSKMSGAFTFAVTFAYEQMSCLLNTDILAYLNANIGNDVYLMIREFEYDITNTPPTIIWYYNGIAYLPDIDPVGTQPELVLTYH